ncbi:hypothetical protein [Pseudomonas sp. SO81]|uniref:hypothetical protein n=1 Tax=Pseudomonas sp. SO81 TaxID=2983246 RepID=UPI0025A4104A|nr:hypothetical protein [Pseudomonas sp. SO81]WJN57552.1 hypothetical protein OH686_02315 [Pseudomonas sp. SO81]
MDWLKTFSTHYANAVTAFAALGAFILAAITLWYLKREYSSKYRPYVFPIVHAEPIPESPGCIVSIIPRNVGPHPCKIKLSKIELHIGDESFQTPDNKEWILLAPQGVGIQMPAGHINEIGVKNIREGRYRKNRIEVNFVMTSTSIENKFEESKSFSYEINVQGETPQAFFRPEWNVQV